MKRKIRSIILSLFIFSVPAYAEEDDNSEESQSKTPPTLMSKILEGLSGDLELTSNYVDRGISNSDNLPAIQGGFTYTLPKGGIYANIWGSSVSFADPDGRPATIELDTGIGITNNILDDLNYDISWYYYHYPGTHGLNYGEWLATLTYKFLGIEVDYSDDVYATGETGIYYALNLNYDIPENYVLNLSGVTLLGTVGYYDLPLSAGYSYTNYMIGLSKTFKEMYIATLQWVGTDGKAQVAPLDHDRLVATLGVNF